jgi:hypothetical protein
MSRNINKNIKNLKNKYSKPISNRNILNNYGNTTTRKTNNTRTNNTRNNTRNNNVKTNKKVTNTANVNAKASNAPVPVDDATGSSSILETLIMLALFLLVLYFLYQVWVYYNTPCVFRKDFSQYMMDGFDSPCVFNKHPSEPVAKPLVGKKEVFNISDQVYTYEQAKCKCDAYGAKLATYSQIVDAYNKGAEWCNYGWSKGHKAYYPTQACTHKDKKHHGKHKKSHCGKPGINGGYFPPSMKFGVNCYGIKPKGEIVRKITPKCKVEDNFCKLPKNFRASNRLDRDNVSPFNKTQWHE